jgi:hypothetical protein
MVAGLEEPNWNDKDKAFDHGATDTNLSEGYVNVKENTVQFRANFSGAFDGSKSTYLVYIDSDTDPETGFNRDTVNSGDNLAGYYDNATGSIGADYRVTVVDNAKPIIEEYNGEAGWDKIKNIKTDEYNNGVTAQIDKETIGNPEVYDLRFAHIEDGAGPQLTDGEYATEPAQAFRVNEQGDSTRTTETATIKTNVQFGDVKVDDEADVQLTVTNDTGQEAGTVEFNYSDNGKTDLQEFTVNPDNFDEDEGEVSVEVLNDDQYLFDRDVDNTSSITGPSAGSSTTVNLHVSTVSTNLTNVDVLNDTASARLNLTDNSGDKTTSREVPINNSKTSQKFYFTVKPDNFNVSDDNKLKVEVLGDSDYPFEKSVEDLDVAEGSSVEKAFDVDSIGHDITITGTNLDIDGGSGPGEFTVSVKLESYDSDGEAIETFSHVIEFDSKRLNVKDISGLSNADDPLPNPTGNKSGYTAVYNQRNGTPDKFGVTFLDNTGSDPVVESDKSQKIYDITFEFDDVDSLRAEEINNYGESINLAPSTAEETELTKPDGTKLTYISSAEDANVYNNNTRATDVAVTHLTEDGNMVNAPTKFEFDIETNNGKIDNVRLTSNSSTSKLSQPGSNDDTKIDCGKESECSDTLTYTPQSSTFDGTDYAKNEDFEVIVEYEDDDMYSIPDNNEEIDKLDAEIYEDGDTSANSTPSAVGLTDVSTVIRNRGEGDGELPWDTAKLARADMNNDGVIDITDVTIVINEYNP